MKSIFVSMDILNDADPILLRDAIIEFIRNVNEDVYILGTDFKGLIDLLLKELGKTSLHVYYLDEISNKYDFYAGIFMGDVSEDDFYLFKDYYPNAKLFPIASIGGTAKELYNKHKDILDARLETELVYGSLFKDILGSAMK